MCMIMKNKYNKVVEENEQLKKEIKTLREGLETLSKTNKDNEEMINLLGKELSHCWNIRMKFDEDGRNGGFSGIEWGGVCGRVNDGLKSLLEEEKTEDDLDNINWLMSILRDFDGEL